MTATLYHPSQGPVAVSVEGLCLPDSHTGLVPESSVAVAATILGCPLQLVDILACGTKYVAYSIFDCEAGQPNRLAKEVISLIAGSSFNSEDEDAELYGAILIVQL
jgi:hypothetical protein